MKAKTGKPNCVSCRPGSPMKPLKRTRWSLPERKSRTRRKTTGTPERTEVGKTFPLFRSSSGKKCCTLTSHTAGSHQWRVLWAWTCQTRRRPGWSSRSSWPVGPPTRPCETKATLKVELTGPASLENHLTRRWRCEQVCLWLVFRRPGVWLQSHCAVPAGGHVGAWFCQDVHWARGKHRYDVSLVQM